ncbi:porin family protein [Dinghuibacter silviterrae]|nr:porin family protein [Dinghuibacter silviterrae]
MRSLALAVLLCSGMAIPRAYAQKPFYLGVEGGVGIPNLTAGGSSPVSKGYSSILGPDFGVFAEYGWKKRWSLRAELSFVTEGGKKNGVQAIPTAPFAAYFPQGYTPPEYFYATFYSKARLNYLQLPLLAKYKMPLGAHWTLSVNLGPYVAYLLNAKTITKDSSMIYYDPQEQQPFPVGKQDFSGTEDITDQIHRFNCGFQGGIAIEHPCGHGYLFLNAGGSYGVINIQRYAEDGKNNTGSATAVIGYALRIR